MFVDELNKLAKGCNLLVPVSSLGHSLRMNLTNHLKFEDRVEVLLGLFGDSADASLDTPAVLCLFHLVEKLIARMEYGLNKNVKCNLSKVTNTVGDC